MTLVSELRRPRIVDPDDDGLYVDGLMAAAADRIEALEALLAERRPGNPPLQKCCIAARSKLEREPAEFRARVAAANRRHGKAPWTGSDAAKRYLERYGQPALLPAEEVWGDG